MSRFGRNVNTVAVYAARILTALIAGIVTWFVVHAVVGAIPVLPLLAAGGAFWWTINYLRKP
jgi:hypothetical protein